MNNNDPKFIRRNENNFNSFENNNIFGNDNLLNQNEPVTTLTKPISVPCNPNDFKTKTNQHFNSSYISKDLGINGKEVKTQHNKPIYQPIIYQPFVMPIMANPMNAMGMGAYNTMMVYYLQTFPYPMMMGYPQMSQYPGILTCHPMVGPDVEQQFSGQDYNFNKRQYSQDSDRNYAIMNPDLMKQQQGINNDFDDNFDDNFDDTFNEGNHFEINHDFNQTNDFSSANFSVQNDFGQGNSNFGPTPDFNVAPSFSSSPDFAPSDDFNNKNVLNKIDATKMPFQYDEETSKLKLPFWAIFLIVALVLLVLAVITIVMFYFNIKSVHELINGWFGLDVPFDPWF